MAARIIYPTNTPWGAQVAELAATVVRAQQIAARIVAAFNSMSAGGAGPWTDGKRAWAASRRRHDHVHHRPQRTGHSQRGDRHGYAGYGTIAATPPPLMFVIVYFRPSWPEIDLPQDHRLVVRRVAGCGRHYRAAVLMSSGSAVQHDDVERKWRRREMTNKAEMAQIPSCGKGPISRSPCPQRGAGTRNSARC